MNKIRRIFIFFGLCVAVATFGQDIRIEDVLEDIFNHLSEDGDLAYEDIEEELGIDLLTLFKALKEGVYYRHPSFGIQEYQAGLVLANDVKHNIVLGLDHRLTSIVVFFEDYGKTWALTKEELESL